MLIKSDTQQISGQGAASAESLKKPKEMKQMKKTFSLCPGEISDLLTLKVFKGKYKIKYMLQK